MSAKLTTAQLRDELDRERAARIHQEKENADMRVEFEFEHAHMQSELDAAHAQIALLNNQLANAIDVASALNTMQPARAAYAKPQWQINREAAMAQAKELALATGSVVRV